MRKRTAQMQRQGRTVAGTPIAPLEHRRAQLASGEFRTIEAEVTVKRRAWLRERGVNSVEDRGATAGPATAHLVSPRAAFELLFLDYMGLDPADLPVVGDSPTEITWLSTNPCPTLDACVELGLDTRTVCRAAYEKSTQAFLSDIDPRLRFVREYGVIRPHAPHCRERILLMDFESHMRSALTEAVCSRAAGNKGYGAVLVLAEQVIARTHDTASTEGDPSLHAEFKAIREAVTTLGSADLCGAVLFSTCEPCPMCTSLAVWANLTTVVYGASIADTARMGRSRILVGAAEIAAKAPTMLEVVGGVLKEECGALYA